MAEAFENLSPIDQLRLRIELSNKQRVPPEQAAANQRQTLMDILAVTPGPGNVMAAQDAVTGAGRTATAVNEGNYLSAGLEGGMSILNAIGAVTGLPVGKLARGASRGASSRMNTFVPVHGGDAAKVRQLADEGLDNKKIYDKTSLFLSGDGSVKRQIPDINMKVKPTRGDTFGDAVSHPELIDRFPEIGKTPIKWTTDTDRFRKPIARDDPVSGGFELSTAGGGDYDMRGPIAKLLQYKIAKMTGGSAALRHGDTLGQLEEAARRAMESGSPEAERFIKRILRERDNYTKFVANRGKLKAENATAMKSVGNAEARLAQMRARLSPEEYISNYPYARTAPYMPRSPERRLGSFDHMIAIPGKDASYDQVRRLLGEWAKYGGGRNFADGGPVSEGVQSPHAAIGAVSGSHDGRADTRPVTLPEGGYVVPADIVSALGDGNTNAGFEKLTTRFPSGDTTGMRRGGGVKAVVSDGEFVISPEHVTRIGKGDASTGHTTLDDFVKQVRQHNIKKLTALPGPNK